MTADHCSILAALSLTQKAGGERLGIGPRISRKSADAEQDIPLPAASYLVHVGAAPARVRMIFADTLAPDRRAMMRSDRVKESRLTILSAAGGIGDVTFRDRRLVHVIPTGSYRGLGPLSTNRHELRACADAEACRLEMLDD